MVLRGLSVIYPIICGANNGVDVYDGDEPFRAVSVSGSKANETPTFRDTSVCAQRAKGNVIVVISDNSNDQIVQPRIRQRGGGNQAEKVEPARFAAALPDSRATHVAVMLLSHPTRLVMAVACLSATNASGVLRPRWEHDWYGSMGTGTVRRNVCRSQPVRSGRNHILTLPAAR